ncbi:MAG TPA: galactokinase, partial [Vicinamibacterales bacterium]|nr:galactokinase [Vicinamibacterales bacterium]
PPPPPREMRSAEGRPGFRDLFGADPAITAAAPGRVNLIGDHTDYNGGFVLPAAIPQRTVVELSPRSDGVVRVYSSAFPGDGFVAYELGHERPDGNWTDYVKGMTSVLKASGLSRGFDGRVDSAVPVGSGLASSAALEIALGRALREVYGLPIDDVSLARAGRRAENEFVGAPVGIMDQMACSLASETSALFLDTRSLEYELIPLPQAAALIVVDSGVAHRHAGGDYAARRRECVEAAARLGVAELRDANEELLAARLLPAHLLRRARHVVTENVRVLEAVEALRAGDLERAGVLFRASHASLRNDFEVSLAPIDLIVDTAVRTPGVFGARLTGGGFGGAVVALAAAGRVREAASRIVREYVERTGLPGRVVVPPCDAP